MVAVTALHQQHLDPFYSPEIRLSGAGLLLAVNIACVNLTSKIVFDIKGIRSPGWREKEKAQTRKSRIYFWMARDLDFTHSTHLCASFIADLDSFL